MKSLVQCINESLNIGAGYYALKHFHPSGRKMPNGIGFQRANYIRECQINRDSFIINEAIHSEQYRLRNWKGGIIVFATTVNAVKMSDNAIVNKIKQALRSFMNEHRKDYILAKIIDRFNNNNDADFIGAYSIGNAFKGKYIGDNGEHFNDKSYTIEINGLSSKGLMLLAQYICRIFKQETVLVKDFNKNKIFLADSHYSNDVSYDKINIQS